MRELEALKGWWNNNKVVAAEAAATGVAPPDETPAPAIEDNAESKDLAITQPLNDTTIAPSNSLPPPVNLDPSTNLDVAATDLARRIAKVYAALPPCTAFIVYSGSGDPREMSRLQAMQTQFKKEYKIKKWDQLSVKWTDVEEQALTRAVKVARDGVAFIGVK